MQTKPQVFVHHFFFKGIIDGGESLHTQSHKSLSHLNKLGIVNGHEFLQTKAQDFVHQNLLNGIIEGGETLQGLWLNKFQPRNGKNNVAFTFWIATENEKKK